MGVFFVVCNEGSTTAQVQSANAGVTFDKTTLLEAPKVAKVVKIETNGTGATGIAEAQRAAAHFVEGSITSTPVAVVEAQWKTS